MCEVRKRQRERGGEGEEMGLMDIVGKAEKLKVTTHRTTQLMCLGLEAWLSLLPLKRASLLVLIQWRSLSLLHFSMT